jgi:ATP-dependent DNA helicase RecQ
MLTRVITLHVDEAVGGFDDTPLHDFLKDKDVLTIREHFFVRHDVPYLAMIVTYSVPPLASPAASAASVQQQEPSWRSLVAPDEVPLCNTLRDWRLERSKQVCAPV